MIWAQAQSRHDLPSWASAPVHFLFPLASAFAAAKDARSPGPVVRPVVDTLRFDLGGGHPRSNGDAGFPSGFEILGSAGPFAGDASAGFPFQSDQDVRDVTGAFSATRM